MGYSQWLLLNNCLIVVIPWQALLPVFTSRHAILVLIVGFVG
jgi:hypothetical protein